MEIPFSEYGLMGITDLSYLKGMMFFTLLYHYIGEELFFNMMRSYYQKYFIQGATLEDFVTHLQLNVDPGIRLFIKEWVFDTQSNHYIVEGLLPEDIIKVYKKQTAMLYRK